MSNFILNEAISLFHTSKAAHLEHKEAAVALGLGHEKLNFIERFRWEVPR